MTQTKEKTLIGKYLQSITPHGTDNFWSIHDTMLRVFIGKTDDIKVGVCSHNAIIERDIEGKGKNPEHFCRRCRLDVNHDGIGRCNDFIIIRNKKCKGPICFDCLKNNPDEFYLAYKKGIDAFRDYNQALNTVEYEVDNILKNLEQL